MTVARISSQLNLQSSDRFLFLYGATSDTFCTPDLRLVNIEQVLHQYLKSQGYRRILFYSGTEKIYFLDAESRDLCLPSAGSSAPPTHSSASTLRFSGVCRTKPGLLKRPTENNGIGSSSANATDKRVVLQDAQVVPYLNKIMNDSSLNSAIVFSHLEDLLKFSHLRELTGRIVEWSRLLPNNHNLCLFVSHAHNTHNDLQQFFEHNRITFGKLQDTHCAECKIDGVDSTEILSLIDYFRLCSQTSVEWGRVKQLANWMSAEGLSLKVWHSRFEDSRTISLEEARRRKWFSGNVSEQPALERLNQMIGLGSVKTAIQKWQALLSENPTSADNGSSTTAYRLHMVFKGNPGTGKTTVARLVGEIYRELGLLKRGHLIEADRSSLVAGYLGQSALKTNDTVDQALDGVLFIDEAYSLTESENDSFAKEAINTLLKRMEDDRHRLAVIMAGYPADMEKFINSNPGFKRRIGTEILFEDYNPEELLSIFQGQLDKNQSRVTSDLQNKLPVFFENLYDNRDKNFGNAGLIETLFQEMNKNRAQRSPAEAFDVSDIPHEYQSFMQSQARNETLDDLLKVRCTPLSRQKTTQFKIVPAQVTS
jgi:hypothetical protein